MDTVNKLVIYQAADGAIELPVDAKLETIWATQKQIAEVFGVNIRTVNEHLGNIFDTDELGRDSVIRNFRITASDGKTYDTKHYNLDVIISVGYRVNSKNATHFRKWATKTLRDYISDGFVINKKRVEHNLSQFTRALNDLKLLSENIEQVGSSEATDLALAFATTWLSLDAYDKSELPSSGTIKKAVDIGAGELEAELHKLRKALIAKGEATDIFATERTKGGLHALFGNVFQSFAGEDVYPTVEEKAAHLLYFVVKNHVFVDGNKRSGAYAFVWFLQKTGLLNIHEISPQALTAITLLVAESKPEDKDKMVGLVLLMLKVDNRE
ncbi:virulence protein RhuM/Fic/DOC family protein [Candidatus Saccharibacteria bacterium]|nr:virulence protein RhuM/Fic/DOC family protein [Candidatus Saccharibacteria bacterium]